MFCAMNKSDFMRFLLLVIILFLSTISGFAQSLTLSLDDAVSIAQTNSPIADAVRSNRRAALWRYKAFRAGLLPNLSISGDAPGYINSINPITQPDGTVRFVGQQQATLSGSFDVSQVVPYTGGRFELSSG